jgi:micrococcal nuclease
MRRLITTAAAVCLLLRTFPAPAPADDEPLRGMVITVYDGDTVRVRLAGRSDEKVRLIGVDSLELDDARETVRLMAFLAKRFTHSRLFRSTVDLLPGPEKRDDYGRLLAFVRTADGDIFNVILVREGFALALLRFPFDEALRKEIKAAETEARLAGRGLWKKEPHEVIGAAEAGRRVGEILTVRFRCLRSYKRSGFRLLEAEGAAFDAAIPLEVFRALPGPLDFEGRRLEATGFVEIYKGRPQIMIGLPVQLKRLD